jgi:hypothetical protein
MISETKKAMGRMIPNSIASDWWRTGRKSKLRGAVVRERPERVISLGVIQNKYPLQMGLRY